MATEMVADTAAAEERWQRMWGHREQLLKVARRRSMSLEDAEDAVHEAMLRAAERPDLDDERLGAWLTTVTMRLCVDRYRQVTREAEVGSRPALVVPGPVSVEEAVCDRAEAKWLAVRSGELPARQAEALRLKSQGLDVSQVAVRMGLSYRTVESLLARARRTLRASLALGLVLLLIRRGRLRGGGDAHAVAVTSMAATLVAAGFVLPYALDAGENGNGPVPRPAVSSAAQVLRSQATGRGRAPGTPAPSHSTPGAGGRALSPTGGTSLPDVSASPLPELSAPQVPQVPEVPKVAGLPTAVPGLRTGSAASSLPSLPPASAVSAAPLSVPAPRTPSRTPSPKLP